MPKKESSEKSVEDFLEGKSAITHELFNHFVNEFFKIGKVKLLPAKTMIGVATPKKRIAYINQFGKNFINVVFMFEEPYYDNLCFQKVGQVPGQRQFNHHFRMLAKEDVNAEVKKFMKLAYQKGKE
jgi:Domain of unknown function (DUF5655)